MPNPNLTGYLPNPNPESSNDRRFFWRPKHSEIPSYQDIRELFIEGARALKHRAALSPSEPERRRLRLIAEGSIRIAGLMEYNGRHQ